MSGSPGWVFFFSVSNYHTLLGGMMGGKEKRKNIKFKMGTLHLFESQFYVCKFWVKAFESVNLGQLEFYTDFGNRGVAMPNIEMMYSFIVLCLTRKSISLNKNKFNDSLFLA